MSSAVLPLRPGVARGLCPERRDERPPAFARAFDAALGFVSVPRRVSRAHVAAFAESLGEDVRRAAQLDEAGFDFELAGLRAALRREGLRDPLLRRGFALIREAARRTLGTPHYAVQIYGGWVMAHGGLAELATGEGKTLTATLPAAVAAMAGIPVHVITANDYLVERDAESMAPLYQRLGLQVGTVVESEAERDARRAAYACDITYVTNKQIAFDYLRDRVAGGDPNRLSHRLGAVREAPVLRGLCFAIIDEADSVLIDDAGTPLILSRPGAAVDEDTVRGALALSQQLEEGLHYRLDRRRHEVELTEPGQDRLAELAQQMSGPLGSARWREQWVHRALSAEHLFQEDRHYVVRDEKIQIIDLPTGRRAPDRAFEGGIHALLEARLGLELTPQRETIARISYQHFFRRYLRLSGMTGTACEVARELWKVYGLRSVAVPTRKPSQRAELGCRLLRSADAKWEATVERVKELHTSGRSVLIGTGTVEESAELSSRLDAAALFHSLLDAHNDDEEASVIAEAGAPGRITVATRMAGRGTDIALAPEVAARGGLAVVSTELAEARRIDRQLFGRCARQGGPGSCEQLVSLDDRLLRTRLPGWLRSIPLPPVFVSIYTLLLTRYAQRAEERRGALIRRRLVEAERMLEELLAFSNRRE